jgi:hypothetical protein
VSRVEPAGIISAAPAGAPESAMPSPKNSV